MREREGEGDGDSIERWLTCFFCGAPMRAQAARHIPAPFSAVPLPACPACVETRERVRAVMRPGASTTATREGV